MNKLLKDKEFREAFVKWVLDPIYTKPTFFPIEFLSKLDVKMSKSHRKFTINDEELFRWKDSNGNYLTSK